jgi:lipopolysaccharide heptosyltransferase II
MTRLQMQVRWAFRRTYRALFATALACIGAALRLAPQRAAPDQPQKILVLRGGLLGDAVLLTPALRLLRESLPAAQIHVVAAPIQRAVLEPLPCVDRVISWEAGDLWEPRIALQPRRWRAAARALRDLRRERYDTVLSCYGPLNSAIALLTGAPRRAGFAGEALPGTLTMALPGERWTHPWHDTEYNVEVVRALGARGDTPEPTVGVAEGDRERATALVGADTGRLVIFHTGATNGRAKRWPADHWMELSRLLHRQGVDIAAVGAGDEDARLANHLVTSPELNLVNRTSLGELIAVLERAAVVVTGDSGPMHVAAALDRPVVGLFGPTDPALYAPFRARRSTVLRHEVPCSPCYKLDRVADCPLGHTLCQRLLDPARVRQAVQMHLESTSSVARE